MENISLYLRIFSKNSELRASFDEEENLEGP